MQPDIIILLGIVQSVERYPLNSLTKSRETFGLGKSQNPDELYIMVVDRRVWPIAGEERANDPVVQKVVDQVIGGSHSFANEKILITVKLRC